MQRITCTHSIEKNGVHRQCQRYLGDLGEGTISIKCPRCGGTTYVAFQQGITLDQLAQMLGGISCESPTLGHVQEHLGSIDNQPI